MSGVTVAEREYYQLLLSLDELDPETAIAKAVKQLIALTGALEAYVELRGPGAPHGGISRSFTAGYVRRTPLSSAADHHGTPTNAARTPSRPTSSLLEAVRETAMARVYVRVQRPDGGRAFTARHRQQLELFLRALARVAERAIPPDLSIGLHEQRRLLEGRLVAAALEQARGNVTEAARMLRVTRAFVYGRRSRGEK